jgi:hypothetical protein
LNIDKATAYAQNVTTFHKSFWNIILKWIFKKNMTLTGQGHVVDCFESGNEHSRFKKCGECLD